LRIQNKENGEHFSPEALDDFIKTVSEENLENKKRILQE
jgi:hypothetical protein